jgi:hypothetical protein
VSAESPHDSYQTHAILKQRIVAKVAPGLKKLIDTKAVYALIAMILLASIGGIGLGFELDTQLISPPAHEYGICAPPGFITANGCFILEHSYQTVIENGQSVQKEINSTVAYGNIIGPTLPKVSP